jgi:putative membrane protein
LTDSNLEAFSLQKESSRKASRFPIGFASADLLRKHRFAPEVKLVFAFRLIGIKNHAGTTASARGRSLRSPHRSTVVMPVLAALPADVLPRAGVAYVHYLSFMLCFGALVLERRLIKANPNKQEATLMVITDVVYGLAALALLVSGIMRVLYFGQGSDFYTENPLFWWKVGLYLGVGGLSLYPTITYILWAIPLRKGELPQVSEALAGRLAWILNIELVGFALVPLLATLMARGVGLPALAG